MPAVEAMAAFPGSLKCGRRRPERSALASVSLPQRAWCPVLSAGHVAETLETECHALAQKYCQTVEGKECISELWYDTTGLRGQCVMNYRCTDDPDECFQKGEMPTETETKRL